ncbi:DMT family transporter [Chelativorans xinjiangense]|uniref:DMT family transporter n=1 Tax=Chelativorans xinjiangense TaxID=2681485 RepID=UPI0024837252|nr:DMT family transporter [Chelativorans xinjiangense]
MLLFLATVVLWGSAAVVTAHQAVSADPAVSVAYRMLLVSIVMFVWCFARKTPLRVAGTNRGWIVLQGVLFFGLSFISFYHATSHIPSGIAALILSTSSLAAALTASLVLRTHPSAHLLAGLSIGIAGLAVVVLPQFLAFSATSDTVPGVLWAVAAAFCTGCGTVVAARNQRAGLPVTVIMGWSALAGAAFSFGWAVVAGVDLRPAVTAPYIAGLVYLAILASCVTFAMYFSLVHRIGPAAAAYALSAVPLVALALSMMFEGLQLTAPIIAGSAAILWGNVIVLGNSNAKAPASSSPARTDA